MSYILDALKKSEQQRSHGSVPDVQTIHSSSLNYKNDKKALWPYILVIAVLLNFFAIVYFIYDKSYLAGSHREEILKSADIPVDIATDKTDAPQTPTLSDTDKEITLDRQTIPQEPATTAAAPVADITKRAQQDTVKDNYRAAPEEQDDTVEDSSLATTGKYDINDVISYHELDDSIKQVLPVITVSAHVYSSNPLQRSIVINNNFMEEGEYLIDDLVLHEITTDGAIFNYHGTLFHYAVVSSWQ